MKKAIFDHQAKQALLKYCFLFLCLLAGNTAFSQVRGKVQVVGPPLFDTLLAKRGTINTGRGAGSRSGYISSYGYRLQIYSGSNRSSVYNVQARFNNMFPELRTYISYREPNFRLKAGDFRSRLEAERLRAQLKDWNQAMFIISEKINPPKTVISND